MWYQKKWARVNRNGNSLIIWELLTILVTNGLSIYSLSMGEPKRTEPDKLTWSKYIHSCISEDMQIESVRERQADSEWETETNREIDIEREN